MGAGVTALLGLAAPLAAQLYSPAQIVMINGGDNRLAVARQFGATQTINGADGSAAETVKALAAGRGVDTAIEAAGAPPPTFLPCRDLVAPGGIIANSGVHGQKVEPRLERPWSQNIAITTRLVRTGTTPMLLNTVQCGEIEPTRLITLPFTLNQLLDVLVTSRAAAAPREVTRGATPAIDRPPSGRR